MKSVEQIIIRNRLDFFGEVAVGPAIDAPVCSSQAGVEEKSSFLAAAPWLSLS